MPLTKKKMMLKFFTDGTEKFNALMADIKKAQHSIHIEYYAFVTDHIGTKNFELIRRKRRLKGVEVRLLYDAFWLKGHQGSSFE